MAPNLYVLMGDVVDSQKVEDRPGFQRTLRDGLSRLNEAYAKSIHTDLRIIKGIDEVAGVLEDPSGAYDLVKELSQTVYPHEITVVLVYDVIDVGVDRPNVAEMDGPAFARADERIEANKRRGFLFDVAIDAMAVNPLLADMVNLLLYFRRTWTDRQREIVSAYETRDTQKAVAEALGVSEGLVSQQLSRARAKQVLEMETRVRESFAELDPEGAPANI